MSEPIKPLIQRTKNKQWKPFLDDVLPASAQKFMNDANAFRSGYGQWLIGCAWYDGDSPETATRWIIVTDDGSYYKVGASYMIWHPGRTETVAQAIWSFNHLKKSLRNLLETGDVLPDPGYQT